MRQMDLSISIVSWNTQDLLDACLKSVYETTTGIEFEVIVVDNASSDESVDMVRRKYAQVNLIVNSENVGFAKANNQAYAASRGRFFLLLNPDTLCSKGALVKLVRFLEAHPGAGAVGPLVVNSDGTLQHSWARFPTVWSEFTGRLDRRIRGSRDWPNTPDEVASVGAFAIDWLGGCCLMVRRSAVEQIGLMDESFFMYSEETDWCYRLYRGGWAAWLDPAAAIVHLGGQSSGQASERSRRVLCDSKVHYARKHSGPFAAWVLGSCFGAKRLLAGRISRGDKA